MEINIKRVQICNVPVDVLTMNETVEIIDRGIKNRSRLHHVAINAAKVVKAQKDPQLKESIIGCNIISADGKSIVWASRFLGCSLPERVAGIDLMEELIKRAHLNKYRIFLLGATEDVVTKVANKYRSLYGNDIIVGFRNGFYAKDEESEIADQISESKAHILFVGITSPKKEIFLNTYKDKLQVPFIMGVGGSFDVMAGVVKRAPMWMQEYGLEWLYRVIQEPRRMWKRYLFGNLQFINLVLRARIKMLFIPVEGNNFHLSEK